MTELKRSPAQAPKVLALVSHLYTRCNQTFPYSLDDVIQTDADAQGADGLVQAALRDRDQHGRQNETAIACRRWVWGGAIVVGVAVAGWLTWSYMALMAATQTIDTSWGSVEQQLQQQANLIPELMDAAQANAQYERKLTIVLAQAQQRYLAAHTVLETMQAANDVAAAINQFQYYVSRYPQWHSHPTLRDLQDTLTQIETRIAVERQRYNRDVMMYNDHVRVLPNSLIAPIFGIEPKPLYDAKSVNTSVTTP